MGRFDKLFDASFGTDDGEAEEVFGNFWIELANGLSGSGGVQNNDAAKQQITNHFNESIGIYADPEKAKQLIELGKGN